MTETTSPMIISPYFGAISLFLLSRRALLTGINGEDILYNDHFGGKKEDIGHKNTYFRHVNL